jgi:hypothetical protein
MSTHSMNNENEDQHAVLSAIGGEVRYRDALWQIRAEVERLSNLVTLSGRTVATNNILATIDITLDIGGKFSGLHEGGNQ